MDNLKEQLNILQQFSVSSFLTKTFHILENSNYCDIIQWNQDGTEFIIKKPYEFAKKILPKYFKHNNYTSFIRQLNLYDFHKIKNELGKHVFKHQLFQKEKKHLLCKIKRKSIDQKEQFEENNFNQTNNSIELSMSKLKKDYQQFHNEIVRVKAQQNLFQHTINKFMTQNDYLINQNSLLWLEIQKMRDIDDKKIETFSYLLATLMITVNQNSQSSLLSSQHSSYYQSSSSDISISQQNYQSNYQDQSMSPQLQQNQSKFAQNQIGLSQILGKQDISLFDQGLNKKRKSQFQALELNAYQNGLAFYQKLMGLQQQQQIQEIQEGQHQLLIKQRK